MARIGKNRQKRLTSHRADGGVLCAGLWLGVPVMFVATIDLYVVEGVP